MGTRSRFAVAAAWLIAAACSSKSASPSPNALFAAAIDSLRTAESVHYTETQTRGPTIVRTEADETADAFRQSTASGSLVVETILVGGTAYQRSPSTQGVWSRLSPSAAPALQANGTTTGQATCSAAEHGHLSDAGHATFDGQPTTILNDDGNAPGASPGRWYVSDAKPPRLVAETHTGPDRPGGPAHCGRTEEGVRVDAHWADYGHPVSIEPPPGAVPAPGS